MGNPIFNKKYLKNTYFYTVVIIILLLLVSLMSSCEKIIGKNEIGTVEETEVEVEIKEGMTLKEVSKLLEEEGVVDSSFFFRLYVEQEGKDKSLIPGKYVLGTGLDYGTVLDKITSGPVNITYNFTIPEGYTVNKITQQIAEEIPFIEYAELEDALDISNYNYDFLENISTLEGFMFPKTYEVDTNYKASDIVEMMISQYHYEVGTLDYSFAEENDLSPYDILIIASMIEREAYVPDERELISAVIHNRLKIGMLLQIDATLTYALDKWDEGINNLDKETDTPYNTYLYASLPPTPICNPGLACIKAALNPAEVDYLYYVVDDPEKHTHHFSNDYEEHEKVRNGTN
jgi:UPF0755 protein